ncbi:hypothetical protein CBM2588_P30040 [Cupriavidus taiwanensis]|nr:hypothetical protein CBM2588_P30040 [Cupriavidus taiwanensis]SOY99949.1 hypothetical protein CBM2591_P30041 [Cupriavidus taiwanensis]SOZ90533.1 hypothetical protein CBM2618_P30040 [Cupriavidus taiwanensis]SOZ90535.1 hypothetical protein CBM2618_P30042 [Cupriavidus taiwanensis]SOZ93069.1 hypothetical protein CBM2622_P30042 [Cupriavidus taiwanensis]
MTSPSVALSGLIRAADGYSCL